MAGSLADLTWANAAVTQHDAGYALLRFHPQLERSFRVDYDRRRIQMVRLGLMLASLLYIVYSGLRLIEPWDALLGWSTLLRGIIVATMLASAAMLPYLHPLVRRRLVVANYLVFAGCLTAIEVLSRDYGMSGRYEGMIFICFHGFVLSGLLFWHALLTVLAVLALYLGGIGLTGAVPVQELGFQTFFLLLTATLGAAAQYLVELRERESWLRQKALEFQAGTDVATGLANRSAFEATARARIRASRLADEGVCLVLVDIDHFKDINDRFGHAAGDAVLRNIGSALNALSMEPGDACARWGGDELIALWNCCRSDVLAQRFETLRNGARHALPKTGGAGPTDAVTISCGGVVITPEDGRRLEDYLRLADQQLYEAKRAGRDGWRLSSA